MPLDVSALPISLWWGDIWIVQCLWVTQDVWYNMWGAAVSNPPHYHYVQGPPGPLPQVGPNGPMLPGPPTRHLRPQSSYSLPHGSNGPGRWGWSGSHVSSFDRRQLKVPPQPARPAPVRPSQNRYTGNNVSEAWKATNHLVILCVQ